MRYGFRTFMWVMNISLSPSCDQRFFCFFLSRRSTVGGGELEEDEEIEIIFHLRMDDIMDRDFGGMHDLGDDDGRRISTEFDDNDDRDGMEDSVCLGRSDPYAFGGGDGQRRAHQNESRGGGGEGERCECGGADELCVGDQRQRTEEEGDGDGLGGTKKRYKNSDGSNRDYDAPAPPNDIDWGQIDVMFDDWTACKENGGKRRQFCLHGDHRYSLLRGGYPDEDFFLLEDTAQSVREANEIMLPFAILADGKTISESPRWDETVEEYLRSRGIKLADSYVIKTAPLKPDEEGGSEGDGGGGTLFGVRAFHIGFRYFMFVMIGDVISTKDGKLTNVNGCPFVSYYYTAITKEQAISNECP
jgi:hypothetical protein